MKNLVLKLVSFVLLLTCLVHSGISQENQRERRAILLEIDGPIGPAMQDYIHRGLDHARQIHAELVILKIDTPGGLDLSMRSIIKEIVASPIPIISYVAPNGARAASAGTYIVYASHVAAMAPATNLGAATPVFMEAPISTPSEKESSKKDHQQPDAHSSKAINDAVAYIKGLAELRNRNVDWAEKAVREAASLQAPQALKLGVIDLIAEDVPALLKQLNGKIVKINLQDKTLQTIDLRIETIAPDWRVRFLKIITDPSIAYILLLIGIYGLFFEFSNPGFVLPGVMGLISLLLALYSLQLLPINYAGLALILAGIIFLVAELYVSSYGILGIGGIIAFIVGSILLFDMQEAMIPWTLIIGMSIFTVLFFLIIFSLVFKARRQKAVSGTETLLGTIGVVHDDFAVTGQIKIAGELWRATSTIPLKRGQNVKVIKIDGLVLTVEPIDHEGGSYGHR